MCQEVCAVKYVLKSKNKELLQNQSDLDSDIITHIHLNWPNPKQNPGSKILKSVHESKKTFNPSQILISF